MYECRVFLVTGLWRPHRLDYGLVSLAKKLREKFGDKNFVGLYKWNELQRLENDLLTRPGHRTIAGVHSYGCSSVLRIAAKHVSEIRIDDFVSTSGIWRPGDGWSPKSLSHNHMLEPTPNFRRVHVFRQAYGRLRGHTFKLSGATVMANDSEQCVTGYNHIRMEGYPPFLKLIETLAGTKP